MKFSKVIIALCAIGIISFLLTAHIPSAWAGVVLKATVNPVQMDVHIVSGQVQGNTNTEVKIELQRKQNSHSSNSSHSSNRGYGSTPAARSASRARRRARQRRANRAARHRAGVMSHYCTRMRQTLIVDANGNLLDQDIFGGSFGTCTFTHTRELKPFSINELQQVCATSTSGTLAKTAVVNVYRTHEDATKPDRSGRTILPVMTTSFQFKAHVTCSGSASSTASHHVSSDQSEKLFAQCVDQNTGVAVQVDMAHGIGNLYLNGNSFFKLNKRYLPTRESMPDNLIELKGTGIHEMYLDKSRRALYFREGSGKKFCKVVYKEDDD